MKTKTLTIMVAGIILLGACKNRGKYEADNKSSMADTVRIDSASTPSPKLVKTAGIGFKVKNVQQCAGKISLLTTNYAGMVIRHHISSTANSSHDVKISDDSVMRVSAFNTTGEMTVKVPAEKLEQYLDSVGRLGIYVNSSNMDMEDKSLDYLSSRLKLNSRKELVARQKAGKVVIKDPSAVLNLKDDLVDEQISNRKIDDAVRYSVVTLNFYQSNSIVKEIIANDPSAYSIPFFHSLAVAFGDGWHIFKSAILLIADLWVFALLGIIAWWVARLYKRKAFLKHDVV